MKNGTTEGAIALILERYKAHDLSQKINHLFFH